MKSLAFRLLFLLNVAIVSVFLFVLTANRPVDCGSPDDLSPPGSEAKLFPTASSATPTPAPPLERIFVRIESDRPDIEVGWAPN